MKVWKSGITICISRKIIYFKLNGMKNLRNIAVIAFVGVLLTCCDYFTGKDIYNATNEPVWMSMTFNGQKHYPDTTFTAEILERVSVVGSQDYYYRISFGGNNPGLTILESEWIRFPCLLGKGGFPVTVKVPTKDRSSLWHATICHRWIWSIAETSPILPTLK